MGDKMGNWRVNIPVTKLEPTKKQVFGYATIIENEDGSMLIDHQGDMIDEAELEKMAYDFLQNSRVGGVMHQDMGVGKLIESFVVTTEKRKLLKLQVPLGWWVGFQITDDSVWKRLQDGELKMFSIGGRGQRVPHKGEK